MRDSEEPDKDDSHQKRLTATVTAVDGDFQPCGGARSTTPVKSVLFESARSRNPCLRRVVQMRSPHRNEITACL